MVRRWSYLNSISVNFLFFNRSNVKPIINVLKMSVFKATTYYWEDLYSDTITYLTRKSYYRRRHINSLVFYKNILSSWSKDYLFFKKSTKNLLNLNLFRYNYILQNIFLAKSQDISSLLGFEDFKLTFLTNRVFNFFNIGGKCILPFFITYKGPYLYVSSFERFDKLSFSKTAFKDEPIRLLTGNNLTHPFFQDKKFKTLDYLLSSIISLFFSKVVSFYSIFILCTLFYLFCFYVN